MASGQTFEAYVGYLKADPTKKVFIKHCNPNSNVSVQQEVSACAHQFCLADANSVQVRETQRYPDHHNNGGKPIDWTAEPVPLAPLGSGCEADYPQHWHSAQATRATRAKTWRTFTDAAMFVVYKYLVPAASSCAANFPVKSASD